MEKHGYVYIMASGPMGTLYIGSTSDIVGRIWQHKHHEYPNSFTARYNCNMLVYYEPCATMEEMVARERQLKKWNRNWKIKLIIQQNPNWIDLYPSVLHAYGYANQ